MEEAEEVTKVAVEAAVEAAVEVAVEAAVEAAVEVHAWPVRGAIDREELQGGEKGPRGWHGGAYGW